MKFRLPNKHMLGGLFVSLIVFSAAAIQVQSESLRIGNGVPEVITARASTSAFGAEQFNYSTIDTQYVIPFRAFHITGKVSDVNSSKDIMNVSLVMYRMSTKKGSECNADNSKCYRVEECVLKPTRKSTELNYNCQVPIKSWISATDNASQNADDIWRIDVVVTDDDGAQGIFSQLREVASSLHLYVRGSLNFGDIYSGSATTADTNVFLELEQVGTEPARIGIKGTDLECDRRGSIQVEQFKWSLKDVGFDDESAVTLTSDLNYTGLILPDITLDNPSRQPLYMNLSVPKGSAGKCSGSIYIVAEQYREEN